MATTADIINELRRRYDESTYAPKTVDQMRAQAEGEYGSYYDQLRLAAQQKTQTSDLALAQQREALKYTYDRQREDALRDYAIRYSQADNMLLGRGMQRSSYGAQVLANIGIQGAKAQQAIAEQQAAAEGNIDAQRAQLAQQLAQQINQYDASQAGDVLNRLRALEDQEYDRGVAQAQRQDSLLGQIASILDAQASREQNQTQFDISIALEREKLAEERRQFDAKNTTTSSSGGYNGSKNNPNKDGTDPNASLLEQLQGSYDDFIKALNLFSQPSAPAEEKKPTYRAKTIPAVSVVSRNQNGVSNNNTVRKYDVSK